MNILVIGDIIGKIGLKKVESILGKLKQDNGIDFVIANGENVAEGMGITEKLFKNMLDLKIDAITLGNHTWAKKEVFNIIEHKTLIRPVNYPKTTPGKGVRLYKCNNKNIVVISLLGRTNIGILSENPFLEMDTILEALENKADILIVDFHAEATAEKIAMGHYLDGRVTAVLGTHTHVQTADEVILPKGTAYITDIGMTGPKNSVIGMNIEASLKRFTTLLPEKYKIAEGECIFNACILEIDDTTCRMKKISRIYL